MSSAAFQTVAFAITDAKFATSANSTNHQAMSIDSIALRFSLRSPSSTRPIVIAAATMSRQREILRRGATSVSSEIVTNW